jgi:choline dehydrogenase-like flavoprotein
MAAKGWDYVVIGAGAAGCVVGGRLSQMLPAAPIVLIEAGRERLGHRASRSSRRARHPGGARRT